MNDPFSTDESVSLPLSATPDAAGTVAALTSAGLSLEAGLRALSEEAPSRRLRRLLRAMSRDLAKGQSPEDVLSRSGSGVPDYLRGLVRAGVQSGQLGAFLEQFLLSVRRRRAAALSFWGMLAYPLFLLPFAALVAVFLMYWILPQFRDIFNSFGMELPTLTIALLTLGDSSVAMGVCLAIPAVVMLTVLAIVLGQFIPGHAWRLRLFQQIPLIGTPSRMRGQAEFCSLLGLLVTGRIPLPEALQLTGAAIHDANLRQGARRLAARVEQGEPLDDAACGLPQISRDLRHLFRWAPRGTAFGDILLRAGEVFSARSRVQTGLTVMMFQPLVFIGIALFLGLVVIALFMPLVKLLNELS